MQHHDLNNTSIISNIRIKMQHVGKWQDFVVVLFLGLVITILLAPLTGGILLPPYSLGWWIFHIMFFLLVSYSTHIVYRLLFVPPLRPPSVPKRILSFDEAIRKSEYNFCAISSKEIALWKSPTFLYYLILNDIKNIIEYNLRNKASVIKFSTEAIDKNKFLDEGMVIAHKIANGEICPKFYGIRLLIYPESVFSDYANEIQSLIQMHATARVHCIPVVREKLISKLTTEERDALNKFAKDMDQNIKDEYTALSRVKQLAMSFKRKKQTNPYNVSIPDYLIINYNPFDRSEESIWWYVREKVKKKSESSFIDAAENCYKIICKKLDKSILWEQYTADIFGMVPVAEHIKYMKVDFFSQDYFQRWLDLIRQKSEFKKLGEWLNKENNIIEKVIHENKEIKTALDIGCGWGRHMEIMLKEGVKKVAGVDKSPLMVEKANALYKEYGDERVITKLEDAQKMTFRDNEFDLVICMTNTFGNLGDDVKMKVLDEMARVLAPGGVIILSVYKDSPTALEIRKNSYISVDLHPFLSGNGRTILTKEGLISEQFREEDIKNWLGKNKKLESVRIIPVNNIAFIATAVKQRG
ncbi:MAG TPA: class I SAM-dependent methyltransferase [Thermoplasmatales archaeon]|nr:class I SAM-dependent methyltransferase [Thermoplasmatales archaeon]